MGIDLKEKGSKWEILQARATPEEKRDIYLCCQGQIGLKYSVVTRIIWRRILYRFRTFPKDMRADSLKEVEQAVEEVIGYIPFVRQQQAYGRKY